MSNQNKSKYMVKYGQKLDKISNQVFVEINTIFKWLFRNLSINKNVEIKHLAIRVRFL